MEISLDTAARLVAAKKDLKLASAAVREAKKAFEAELGDADTATLAGVEIATVRFGTTVSGAALKTYVSDKVIKDCTESTRTLVMSGTAGETVAILQEDAELRVA